MKADTGQLQEFLKLNDISAMVMSIASRSFSYIPKVKSWNEICPIQTEKVYGR